MIANVYVEFNTEFIDGNVELVNGFVIITGATQRELSAKDFESDGSFKSTFKYLASANRPEFHWRIVKKCVNIILPAHKVLWIEPLGKKH